MTTPQIPNPDNATDAYSIYTDGNNRGAFLSNPDGSQYIGDVWPGYTVFPDWHSPQAIPWWTDGMLSHHSKVNWSGIWIDMSEASSFCIGSCGTGNLSLNPVHPPFGLPGEPGSKIFTYPEGFNLTNATEAKSAASLSASQASSVAKATPTATTTTPFYTPPAVTPGVRNVDNPPYVINNVNGALGVHALSPNATHVDKVQEYDVHNLNGYQILNATYSALKSVFPGKRPFIIGRSTFAGSGKHAGHWGGEYKNTWQKEIVLTGSRRQYFFVRLHVFQHQSSAKFCPVWHPIGESINECRLHLLPTDVCGSLAWTHVVSTATRMKSCAIDGCSCPPSSHFIATITRSPQTLRKRIVSFLIHIRS